MKVSNPQYKNKAWYALRRTLPLWSWEKNLEELEKYCPKCGIDEVIVKVDTEEFSHGIPTIEWLKEYQPILFEIKHALDEMGVVFSINPWVTHVPGDRGRNVKDKFLEMGFMVGHDGTQCADCACPLSFVWREHTASLWKIYAETKPDTIWVEDDIRTFNHFPVKFGCFCQKHLKRFSLRVDRNVSREELVNLILKPGEPHPYRREWLDMQGEIMVEVAGILSKSVHDVLPEIKVGLMSSGPDNHCLEGRKWHSFIYAFSGNNVPVSRPPLGNYSENHLKGLCYTANSLRRTRYVLPLKTIEMVEVENYPFSQYNKSNMFTFLQSAVCFSMGAHGLTMNLFDHCGTPMIEEISILQSLKKNKKYLKALSDKCVPAGKFKGIRILHHDQCSYKKYLNENANYLDLREESFGWENPLQALGFGTTYDKSNLIALSGQSVRCLEHDEIIEILSGGVLCDLNAISSLLSMGYGEYLGVDLKKSFKKEDAPIAAEHFFNPDFKGEKDRYFALTIYPGETQVGELHPLPGAIEVSEIVNPDTARLFPGLTLFENSLGGRIAVYPFDMNLAGDKFPRPARQIQMINILKWLSRDKIPLLVTGGHNTLPFRMDYDDRIIVGLFCLSLDSWDNSELIVAIDNHRIKNVMKLNEAGEWRIFNSFNHREKKLIISYKEEMTYKKPLIFELKLKSKKKKTHG